MGCDLPKIHIEWDEAHAAGLKPELRTYRQIVSRLGSHEGVETSLETPDSGAPPWEPAPSDASKESPRETGGNGDERGSLGGDQCGNAGGDECSSLGGGSVLHDVRAMCRSLGRLRDLGATVTIDGREATVSALDAYEDALAREVCQLCLNESSAAADSGSGTGSHENGGIGNSSFLSAIVYVVGLAVVLQWFFSCS